MSDRTLHLIGNSHIDPVWLWQWPEGYQEVRATFRSALDRMTEYPEFIFTCDSAAYYEWIEEIDPDMFGEIQARVAEGRWELVGGWWVEPDCNIPGGESFVRQALISQRFFLEKFGRIATVGYNVDPFGHNAMLPQLLRRSGMDSYVFMRPGPHELPLPAPVFWWQSPDGSRVLAYRLPHEYCSSHEDLGYHLDKTIAQLPEVWTEMMAFYGVGNHGGGPTRENLESIRRLDGAGAMPRLRHSTPRQFFDLVLTMDREPPVYQDDLQHHAVGCYSAHSGIKRWMRRAENALAAAEAWSSVASAAVGIAYPSAELSRAWKQVLFNQFHDTLGGTAIEPAYQDARDQLGEARAIAARAENVAIQSLGRCIGLPVSPDTTNLVVFNPHAWPVRTLVELEFGGLRPTDGLVDDDGRSNPIQNVQSYATVLPWRTRIAFEADLPPLGYRTYRVVPHTPRPATGSLRAEATTIENDHLRLEVDPATGSITALVLRANGRDVADVIEPGRSRVAVIDDTSDTWGHRSLSFRNENGQFETTSVELVETGPVRAILRVDGRYGESRCIRDYVVSANSRSVEVRVILDWREKAKLMKLRFATRLTDVAATYEIPYGAIERPADGAEEPGQRWVDASGVLADKGSERFGLAVLNDGKYGFDVMDGEIGVTGVRSPIYAHHEPMTPAPGVRYQFQDQTSQRFTLALVPHRGEWNDAQLTRRAVELNQRPTILQEAAHPGSLPTTRSYAAVEPVGVIIAALKLAHTGDGLVVRFAETDRRNATVTADLTAWDRRLEFEIGPFEIRTFWLPADPDLSPVETDLLERPMGSATHPSADRPVASPMRASAGATAPRTGSAAINEREEASYRRL